MFKKVFLCKTFTSKFSNVCTYFIFVVFCQESDAFLKMDPSTVAKEIVSCHDSDKDGFITMEEYLVWTVNNVLCDDFLDLLSQVQHFSTMFKVYKAISDSLENCKIINYIVLSIILNYLIFIIKLWMDSVLCVKHQQNHKICIKNTLLYNVLFWKCAVIMYNNLLLKHLLKAYRLMIRWVFCNTFLYFLIPFWKCCKI